MDRGLFDLGVRAANGLPDRHDKRALRALRGVHPARARVVRRRLPDKCVGLVLSDLPSGETAAEFDKPIDLEDFWESVKRILSPCGSAALMASSMRFAATLMASMREWFRYDLVW